MHRSRAIVLLATGSLALISLLSACAPLVMLRRPDVHWELHYQPAPQCRVRVVHGSPNPRSRTATLVVQASGYGGSRLPSRILVALQPTDSSHPQVPLAGRSWDTQTTRVLSDVPPGVYVMGVISSMMHPRTDTITVAAGAHDTVHVALESWYDRRSRVHNCEPRQFRRAGEPACVTDTALVRKLFAHAERMAVIIPSSSRRMTSGHPPTVRVVHDERICDRASRAYGDPGDPPRRMFVARVGDAFLVFDPYEPKPAGEWDLWIAFDRHWRHPEYILG